MLYDILWEHGGLIILKQDGSNPPLMNIQEKHIYEGMKGSY